MTGIVILTRLDAVHLLTDGAGTDSAGETGKMLCRSHKVHMMPASRFVCVARGIQQMVVGLREAVDISSRDLDQACDQLPEIVRRMKHGARTSLGMSGAALDLDVFVAGWSPRLEAMAAFLVSSIERPGAPAGEAHHLVGIASPDIDPAPDFEDISPDPAELGLSIMREQRRKEPEFVNGHCQLTSVYRERIETRCLEFWPHKSDGTVWWQPTSL